LRSRKAGIGKIQIVDDDRAVQATIKLLLERAGHAAAGDGREGLTLFEAGDFDLLLLDIFMPGMDGLELMRLVHQQQPLVPIIVISGRPIVSDAGSGPDFLTHGDQARRHQRAAKAVQASRLAGGPDGLP
jgi:CheY-like chemotaxis protein